jgi:Histidine kinase/Two component regulator propeller
MMKIALLPFLLFFIFPCIAFAQEYSYTHYDVKEGLAGSAVYCITQDKDGFIWMGTETGVSRFDGSHFKNFTPADGLPDLEVLQIFGDSKGRVWMAPFRKSVCYYYKGSIHNEQNDPALSRIHFRQNVESFAEDAGGNILIQERNALHLLRPDGSTVQYDSLGHDPIRNCLAVSRSPSGHFLVEFGEKIIEFSGKDILRSLTIHCPYDNPNYIAMSAWQGVWEETPSRFIIRSFLQEKIINRPMDSINYRHIGFSVIADSLVYHNESSGSLEYNTRTGMSRHFLPGKAVSRVFRDATGDLWFTTLGDGLFRLNSAEIKTIPLTIENGETSAVNSIARIGHELWIGDNHNYIFRLSLPDLSVRAMKPDVYYMRSRILFIDAVEKDKVLSASDYGLIESSRQLNYIREIQGGIKSVSRIDDHKLLVGCSWGAAILDLPSFRLKDTLWRERSTVVYYREDTAYIGTLNGLYRSANGRPLDFLGGKIPFLRKRISCIAGSADGTLWIASYDDAGIIGYRNDRIVARITRKEGLTSDICRTLLVHNDILWAGTDKGLNKIELDQPGYPVTQYTSGDGLGSDMVNTLLADSAVIYVGTNAGLSFFNGKEARVSEGCQLYLLSLSNSGKDRMDDTASLVIPYTDKHVRFEFAGISYRSAGEITYRYRMKGLDSTWRETKEAFLEYPALPSGDFEWQLIAVNKFGVRSRMLSLPVTVAIQFWKTAWFTSLVWLLSLLLLWSFVSLRLRRLRRRQMEKERLTKKMSELENTALKAQMNPHFIFNCLNSIQQFIFVQNMTAANKYISGLARLIRITLHNSSRAFIYIEDEVDYLSSFLALEKMRFKDKIDYAIEVDSSIDQTTVQIPPMLIQPYVENAIQHGLRYDTGRKGMIGVRIHKDKDHLIVTVEDNGIGRQRATAEKTHEEKGHASKGMSLIQDRIGVINTLYGGDTRVEIIDLQDEDGTPSGTRIIIRVSIFQEKSLYF